MIRWINKPQIVNLPILFLIHHCRHKAWHLIVGSITICGVNEWCELKTGEKQGKSGNKGKKASSKGHKLFLLSGYITRFLNLKTKQQNHIHIKPLK